MKVDTFERVLSRVKTAGGGEKATDQAVSRQTLRQLSAWECSAWTNRARRIRISTVQRSCRSSIYYHRPGLALSTTFVGRLPIGTFPLPPSHSSLCAPQSHPWPFSAYYALPSHMRAPSLVVRPWVLVPCTLTPSSTLVLRLLRRPLSSLQTRMTLLGASLRLSSKTNSLMSITA